MIALPLIHRKRDGGRLTDDEIHALVREYHVGSVPDYQMAAFLMATFFRGLDRGETAALTRAMLESGDSLELDDLPHPRIDKHSTGGVGDKVSIILAPLMSVLGVAVPMMSGRGLGHTGGTLDKLESIPGFRTDLSLADARTQLERLNCVLIGQTAEIAPVDRRTYPLRSATATVESIPLIAASIMSKKLAEGLTGLVLDVKRGSGAFLPPLDKGLELARMMIDLGSDHGCPTVALLTAMDRPLGRAVGNALEIEESVHALHGEGPDDLMEVTYALGAEMMLLARVATSHDDARAAMHEAIMSGRAAERFAEVIEAQGGNPGVVDDPAVLPQAPKESVFTARRDGMIACIEPRTVGRGVTELGGNRVTMEDPIDPSVGFVISARPGDQVTAGEPLATIYARDDAGLETGRRALSEAIEIANEMRESPLPLVSHRVSARGIEELPFVVSGYRP
jgi:pyrimidine-nucleoside phosphorylase